MLNEKQIKTKLQELIDDFKEHYEQYKKELEANTETKLVEPLFELLGWTKKDFVKQEKARRETRMGHADYAFYIGDKIAFFLEVKKVGIPLEREADKQVISYALSKRVSFAVSTNFEELKIFCVEQEDALRNKFRVFNSPDDYLSNFDDLLFLSKESFEQGLTLKKAEREGRLKRRVSIDRSLLEDLMHIRSLIASDIEKSYPGKYQINEKDEIIQRIIDRLIFIRRCEDTGINPENVTLKEVQDLPDNKAYSLLKEIFKRYNEVYNSGLFAIAKDNDCDKITIDGEIIKKLTQYLYESKDGEYIYNFDWIDADVLGQVYEQYLGKLLAQTKSGKAKLTNGQAHRKEQGIYYTPTYIVDYIVKNTVGELLKNKKTKGKDLKILDPACGSGSFLIKAFDYLHNNLSGGKESKQYRIDSQGKYSIKTEILKNNLYGVDLDNKAVEITKLNLLLKAAEKDRRLPEEIDVHIKHGNSLIDDEAVVGLNAFKWEEQFKEIMRKGGFDVVIGNPPYGAELQEIEKTYLKKRYEQDKTGNTASFFIFKGVDLLKDNGYIAFIVPKQLTYIASWESIRKILMDLDLVKVIDASEAFPDVELEQIIFIAKKSKKISKKIATGFSNKNKIEESTSNINYFNAKRFPIWITEDNHTIFDKVCKGAVPLSQIAKVNWGGPVAKFLSKDKTQDSIPCLRGREIHRYKFKTEYFIKNKDIVQSYYVKGEKLFFQRIVSRQGSILIANYRDARIVGTYCKDDYYADKTVTMIWDSKINLKYLLGLLNSRLISWFAHRYLWNRSQLTMEFMYEYARNFPIRVANSEEKIKDIVTQVDRMLVLNKRLSEIADKKTSESAKLEEEIKKTDNEIDQLVYDLYGLTKKEIAIVEESKKKLIFIDTT